MIKQKIKLEYMLHSTSKHVIWEAISTSAGLERWFADSVVISDRHVTFSWGAQEIREAEIIAVRLHQYIRFYWLDEEEEKSYFELRMNHNEITGKYMLLITDFADSADSADIKMQQELWDKQIEELTRKTGL